MKRLATSTALLVAVFLCLPVARFDRPLSAVLLARDGELLSASVAADGQWRFEQRGPVPAKFAAAIMRYEDKRFLSHPGVDLAAIARAVGTNWRAGQIKSGASTLTMQVVRLWRDGKSRTYGEKIVEMALALRLELSASKEKILEMYAAQAPFGGNVVGLDAAAWRYFGVAPERLSWAEAATLAVLPNSPSLVHPGRHEALLLARRNRLLERLAADATIDEATLLSAQAEPLPQAPLPIPQLAPHLLARSPHTVVRSTIDAALQRQVSALVESHARQLAGNGVENLAVVVLDVDSGNVLAYVGNAPGGDGAFVDCALAPRSTGSILKPLLYAAALDSGDVLPTELLDDTPLRIGNFAPENYSRTFSGATPAALAVAKSLNVPTVRLLHDYGVDRFHALLLRLGLSTIDKPAAHYGLALILGGAEARLLDVTGVYASLARHVVKPSSFPIGAGASYIALQAMLEVERPGTDASWRTFAAPRRIAWKTGTSFGFRDAWSVGVTSRYAVGVWAGNADGEGRQGLTGLQAAAPLMFRVFDALPSAPWFSPPSADLVHVKICKHSGQRAGPYCTDTEDIDAPKASLLGHSCAYCQLVHTTAQGDYRVHGSCEPVHAIKTVERFVLPPVMEWFYRTRHADYAPLPPWRADCAAGLGSGASMSLISPKPGSAIYVPVELDGTRGRAVFEAAHRNARATLYWHLDDDYVGSTKDLHQLALAPMPGAHVLTLVDDNGERLERRFTVIGREEHATR